MPAWRSGPDLQATGVRMFLLGFLLGALTVLAVQRLRRRPSTPAARTGPPPKPAPHHQPGPKPKARPKPDPEVAAARAELRQNADRLAKEIDKLAAGPAANGLPADAAQEYELAVAELQRARRILKSSVGIQARDKVRQALGESRAALIRLDARLHNRPVPIEALGRLVTDAVPANAQTYGGERFHYTGSGTENTEVLVDWPDPRRRSALVQLDVTAGTVTVTPKLRTAQELKTYDRLLTGSAGSSQRARLTQRPTHLLVEPQGKASWSLRLMPVTDAPALGEQRRGRGRAVFAHDEDEPLILGVQVLARYFWKVIFVGDRNREKNIFGTGESRQDFYLPGRGLLVIEADDDAEWSVNRKPEPPQDAVPGQAEDIRDAVPPGAQRPQDAR